MSTTVHLLHAGYVRDDGRVAGSVALVRDGDTPIVADPGWSRGAAILDPLAALGVAPEAVTHVFLSHHHPDQPSTSRSSRTPRWSTSGRATGTTCGSTTTVTAMPLAEDAALAHARAHGGGRDAGRRGRRRASTPSPTCGGAGTARRRSTAGLDQAAIEGGRERVLAAADIVIPGHGEPFRVRGCDAAPPGRYSQTGC